MIITSRLLDWRNSICSHVLSCLCNHKFGSSGIFVDVKPWQVMRETKKAWQQQTGYQLSSRLTGRFHSFSWTWTSMDITVWTRWTSRLMDEWTGLKNVARRHLLYVSILSIKTCPFVSILSIASIVSLSIKKRDVSRCVIERMKTPCPD